MNLKLMNCECSTWTWSHFPQLILQKQTENRCSVGAHNQGVNRMHLSGKNKNTSVFSLLTGSWLQYFRPCFAAFIYFLYLYIIIITLGMTVDLPQLNKINDKIILIAKETPFNERFGSWINLRFIIIIFY